MDGEKNNENSNRVTVTLEAVILPHKAYGSVQMELMAD